MTPSSPTRDPRPRLAPPRPDDPATVGGLRVVGRVGTGGMGTVYAARRGVFGRSGYTAVKVIRNEFTDDPGLRERFDREVRLLGRVRSRWVPALVGFGQDADGPWLATEFVPGLSLSDHVRRYGPLPPHLLLGLAAGVAEALDAAHRAGVVHRDLKPGNVMVAPDGPKVLDFGIARAVDETALTRTGGVVGTPGWIAPEVLGGAPPAPPADLFAWGALVVFAATGRAPFGEGPTDAPAHRVLSANPDLTGVPPHLLPLVSAALDHDPARRPTAARAASALAGHPGGEGLAEAVGALLSREWRGVAAVVPAPPPRSVPKALVAAGAVVLLVGAVGGGVLAARVLDTDEEPGSAPEEASGAPEAAGEESGGAGSVEESGGAETEWVPPDPVSFDTNAEWLAEVITSPEGEATFQATPDNFGTLTYVSVTSVQSVPEGVRFGLNVLNLLEEHDVPAMLTVTTPEAPIGPAGSPGPVAIGDELELTFPDAPEQGLLTFGDPDHVPDVSGVPPVSMCYDAGAGTLSVEPEDCA